MILEASFSLGLALAVLLSEWSERSGLTAAALRLGAVFLAWDGIARIVARREPDPAIKKG
jgi:hypothetical protein